MKIDVKEFEWDFELTTILIKRNFYKALLKIYCVELTLILLWFIILKLLVGALQKDKAPLYLFDIWYIVIIIANLWPPNLPWLLYWRKLFVFLKEQSSLIYLSLRYILNEKKCYTKLSEILSWQLNKKKFLISIIEDLLC